ncbi:MAG: hypothetical protein R3B09_19505 [Nannocystaceae bacterium]
MTAPTLPKGYGPRRRSVPPALKLWVALIVANVGGMLVSVYTAGRIRAVPSESTETWLFVAYYAAIGIAAIVDALWLDEMLFKGAFRRTHLQGKTAETVRPTDDVETVAASLQRSTMSFPFLLIASGFVTYLVFNQVNGNFNFYWRTLGQHIASLRGDDPETEPRRLKAIAELSIRRAPTDRTLVPRVLASQLPKGGEVGVWAAWALGRFSDLPPRQRGILHDALTQAIAEGDDRTRRESVIALARLQHRPVTKALVAELEREVAAIPSGKPLDLRLIYSTGWVQTMASVPALSEILVRGDVEAQRLAAWALAQHRDEKGGREVIKILEARLPAAPLLARCAIVHALGITSDEGSNLALLHAHDIATGAERDTECPLITIGLRPDGEDEKADLLKPVDTYEMKILHTMGMIRATTPAIRAEVEPWLERVIGESEGGSLKRSRAESLLEGIRAGRDDTTAPPKALEPANPPKPADAAPTTPSEDAKPADGAPGEAGAPAEAAPAKTAPAEAAPADAAPAPAPAEAAPAEAP